LEPIHSSVCFGVAILAPPRIGIAAEVDQIALVRRQHAQRIAIVPWQLEEPIGVERLRRLAGAAPVGTGAPVPDVAGTGVALPS